VCVYMYIYIHPYNGMCLTSLQQPSSCSTCAAILIGVVIDLRALNPWRTSLDFKHFKRTLTQREATINYFLHSNSRIFSLSPEYQCRGIEVGYTQQLYLNARRQFDATIIITGHRAIVECE